MPNAPAIGSIDLSLIAAYLVIVVILGLFFTHKEADASDYFLAGRKLHWSVIGLSLFASNISSTTLVGLAGAAYVTGISIANYEWMASVVLVFFAIYFIPYYLSARLYTMPEFLERRFDAKCRNYFSVLTIVGNIFIDTAGTLYAGALVIQFFFPNVDFLQSATALAILAGIYTSAGGLAAVVYTDALQALVLMLGALLVTYLGIEAAGSWAQVVKATPPEMLSLIRPLNDPTMPWLGTLVGVPILGFYFWCTNQFIVQRVLGARDIRHARWGALFAGFLKLPVLFFMVFPGIIARQLFPDLAKADLVFPTLVTELLPVGVKGIVLAGLLAAIMSSLDSTLNSASTLVSIDFVKKLRPKVSERGLATVGRVVTLVFMMVAVAWVPVVAQSETLFHYLQSALAYLFPPVVAVFCLGLFWRGATAKGALVAMVGGHIFSLAVFALQQTSTVLPEIHFLLWTGVFFLVSTVILLIVSAVTEKSSSETLAQFTWSKAGVARATADLSPVTWYQDYRVHSAILLVLTALMVWAYR